MPKEITYQEFLESIDYYCRVLRKAYLESIANATDLAYSQDHFQRLYFLENQFVPYSSVLFQEFRFAYHHFQRLNIETAYANTLDLLDELRGSAKKQLDAAEQYQKGNLKIYLSVGYMEQLEKENFTLEELIANEKQVLTFTDENLIASLSLHLAGQKLYKEFKDTPTETPIKTQHQFQFTRNEQLLALHFLIRSFGINPSQACDRTKLSALFHLIMGVPFESPSKLKDLSIYKALSVVPQVVKKDKQLLIYLQNIRTYFLEANFIQVVDLIDKQIAICNNSNK
jgi:hypothetical protein